MRDRSQFLPLLFSLGIHGAIASFMVPFLQEIPKRGPLTIAVEWENASQIISEEPYAHPISSSRSSRHLVSGQMCNGHKKNPSPAFPREGGQEQVRGPSPSVSLSSLGKQDARNPIPTTKMGDDRRITSKNPYQPLPKYPWICRKRGQEGRVSLLIQTNREGRVIRADLRRSSGHAPLDQAALETVKTWIFVDGANQKHLTLAFRLKV